MKNAANIYEGLEFTETELIIMQGILEGKNNTEIARDLNYSPGTVRNAVSKLLSKLGMKNRIQLAVFYSRLKDSKNVN